MKSSKQIERLIRQAYLEELRVPSSPEMDRRILDAATAALEQSRQQTSAERPSIWRTIMASRTIRVAPAALALLVVGLLVILPERTMEPAYAIEQTVEAIKRVETVHMAGEFYRQGEFECWMKFDGDPDHPTHMWLGTPQSPITKICTPEHVFGLNRRTKAVHLARRDERHQDWVLPFGSFFEEAVESAGEDDAVKVYTDEDAETQEKFIFVYITRPEREQEFLVDPETKLPARFRTVREDAPAQMLRRTLAVKSLEWIRYNEEPPEGLFDMPEDARFVDKEIDALVYPEAGMPADGLTEEQACVKLVDTIFQAINDGDRETFERFCLLPLRDEHWQVLLGLRPVQVERNEPYSEGEFWYVPCRIILSNGRVEPTTPMIKFYEMEGKSYCFHVGSKERGLVD